MTTTMRVRHFNWTQESVTEHDDYEAALTRLHEDHAHDFGMANDEPTSELLLETMLERGWSIQIEEEGDSPCCPDPGCPGNPCTFPGYVPNN